jgi:hypothetical protein
MRLEEFVVKELCLRALVAKRSGVRRFKDMSPQQGFLLVVYAISY